jgi:pretoxin HINT domain-containing protein
MVQEVYQNYLPLMELRFGRACIRTTIEHPFWVEGRGWLPANLLMEGDRLRSHDGETIVLTGINYNLEPEPVYNLQIDGYHTYFVGSGSWGFSVWAHNSNPACVPDGHYLEWDLKGPRGGKLGNGEEFSGVDFAIPKGKKLTFPEQAWFGHTEGKVISDLWEAGKLRPGRTLNMEGILPPCSNCKNILQWASENFKMTINYMDGEGKVWTWVSGVLYH